MKLLSLSKYIPKKFKENILEIHSSLNKTFLKKHIPLRSLYIETTSFCNLKCKGCYRNNHDYPPKNINLDLFKKFIDRSPSSSSLYLHGLGEPTVHPNINEIIEYASKSKKFNNIAFTTNALAKKPEDYTKLFSNGLTQITISVDSLDQKEVMKIRPPTNVKKLTENIRILLEKFPGKVKISMTVNKINKNTFEKTIKKLHALGVREISFHPYEDLGYPSLCISYEEKKEFLHKLKDSQINMALYPSGFTPVENYCKSPSTAPYITVTGHLTPCCRICDEKLFNAGNLNENSFKEIFYSKKYSQIQKDIEKGKYPPFCKGCTSNHIEVKNLRDKEDKG
ncbi:MAG: radical SAM protein [Nanoarchaeota archaeon]